MPKNWFRTNFFWAVVCSIGIAIFILAVFGCSAPAPIQSPPPRPVVSPIPVAPTPAAIVPLADNLPTCRVATQPTPTSTRGRPLPPPDSVIMVDFVATYQCRDEQGRLYQIVDVGTAVVLGDAKSGVSLCPISEYDSEKRGPYALVKCEPGVPRRIILRTPTPR